MFNAITAADLQDCDSEFRVKQEKNKIRVIRLKKKLITETHNWKKS